MSHHMLIINPGSTSTKVALFDGKKKLSEQVIRHEGEKLRKFDNVADQFEFRMEAIDPWIDSLNLQPVDVKAVVGIGAPLRPLEGGSYAINDRMLEELQQRTWSNHASNLGAIISFYLGDRYGVPAMIVDPITTDNFTELARVSGIKEIKRKCRSHALNLKEVCRRQAARAGTTLEDVNFVAVHMGGGISVAALARGRVVDVNDGLLGMGPFSPDRCGAVPIGGLVKLCYSGKYSEKEMLDKLSKHSGLVSYLGESDLRKVEEMIDAGDERAELYFNAMAYQIAKEIGAAAVVLEGEFQSVVLTGGMANSERLVDQVARRIEFLGDIHVVPGEFEMEALAAAGYRFLTGEEDLKEY
ncbi:butyrate kinase [candidate division GN15 bacterium]|nr:butyrate kinase [candidate division GN15 bacterium]